MEAPGTYSLTFATTIILAWLFAPQVVAQDESGKAPPASVGVDKITIKPLLQTAPVIGRLVERQSGEVAARINGPVGMLNVDVGDRVKKGDILAKIVDDELRASRNLSEAEVAKNAAAEKTVQARLALVRQEFKRLEILKNSAAFSKARYDDKRQDVIRLESEKAEAGADLKRAQANLKLAEINLYNALIRAPYDGVVSQRHTAIGAYLDVGDSVVTLINDSLWEIEADVPAVHIPSLSLDKEIKFDLEHRETYTAHVRAIVPDENPRTRTRAVRFTLGSGMGASRLAANETVVLHLPKGEAREAATVSKDAVITRKGQNLVYVVTDDQSVQISPVKLGLAVGNRFEVINGLAAGDLVVIRGNERLQPGQKVQFESIP
ncbi:MAG: efflux RND transporter periplasmic adaptor subunit [Alphaproteobacteria bacterium]|jgi:RND family efflux transporter MFP subunit|nr:efflux RND transporter periplasmic adaptor subunit [Alphaproteobacteria bacterium]MDP7182484.1 efflux RND transporter periplasmic adaptor subunit [Alphaproteobacteria bacterium]MDP7456731.1 efflux RND transporter periplasmic adaptor subunit [Alphaproteobacteria bacterium]HJO89473.1 efflux RND transporter periplasmic adaptor subunit [Alphaproteobacteria bacterium]|tara:strand:- start:216 stop:1349 length:1134 start_codon:yes stop_codon:yes gene_type:complete